MLVASLQFLSAEFEDQVLIPVTMLKAQPVVALQRMIDLYLDPDIASPRKVSVWYAFWGEASSRQEYYDICGQRDESSAALVHELIQALIAQTAEPHLDADGIALGLIGALEILWQDIAFQTERDIDRPAAKRRCMAYLRSVFPGCFDAPATKSSRPDAVPAARLPRWAYGDSRLSVLERASLFQPAWTIVGHESQLPHDGDFLSVGIGVERVLLVRDASGVVRALRNNCPEVPHALVEERAGHLNGELECHEHGLFFAWDGTGQRRTVSSRRRRVVSTSTSTSPRSLEKLDCQSAGGLLWVRPFQREPRTLGSAKFDVPLKVETAPGLMMLGSPLEVHVATDWKVLVEHWLQSVPPDAVFDASVVTASWDAPLLIPTGWSAARYRGLLTGASTPAWRRQFVAPHQLLESRPDGLSVLQAFPTAPGRTLLRRLDYSALPPDAGARALLYLAQRLGRLTRRTTLRMAESVQRGFIDFGYELSQGAPLPARAVVWFHEFLSARLPAMMRERPPSDR